MQKLSNNQENIVKSSISYREILEKNDFYIATPIGTSMLPLLKERVDTVKLVKPTKKIEKYDVILYERPNNMYVLHRVLGIKRKNGEELYVLCGDNQVVLEKYVKKNQIIGVMEGYYKGESYISKDDLDYKKYVKRRVRSRKWRKLRALLSKIYHKIFKKKK